MKITFCYKVDKLANLLNNKKDVYVKFVVNLIKKISPKEYAICHSELRKFVEWRFKIPIKFIVAIDKTDYIENVTLENMVDITEDTI